MRRRISLFKKEETPVIENHDNEYVNLGLPSGLLWSRFDVGELASPNAQHPSQSAQYFTWGNIVPMQSYGNPSYSSTPGVTFGAESIPADPAYDAACAWDSQSRMPTKAEYEELIQNCTFSQSGSTITCTSNINGAQIYFTSGGYYTIGQPYGYSQQRGTVSLGFYWTSDFYGTSMGYCGIVSSSQATVYNTNKEYYLKIKGVRESQPISTLLNYTVNGDSWDSSTAYQAGPEQQNVILQIYHDEDILGQSDVTISGNGNYSGCSWNGNSVTLGFSRNENESYGGQATSTVIITYGSESISFKITQSGDYVVYYTTQNLYAEDYTLSGSQTCYFDNSIAEIEHGWINNLKFGTRINGEISFDYIATYKSGKTVNTRKEHQSCIFDFGTCALAHDGYQIVNTTSFYYTYYGNYPRFFLTIEVPSIGVIYFNEVGTIDFSNYDSQHNRCDWSFNFSNYSNNLLELSGKDGLCQNIDVHGNIQFVDSAVDLYIYSLNASNQYGVIYNWQYPNTIIGGSASTPTITTV